MRPSVRRCVPCPLAAVCRCPAGIGFLVGHNLTPGGDRVAWLNASRGRVPGLKQNKSLLCNWVKRDTNGHIRKMNHKLVFESPVHQKINQLLGMIDKVI